MRLHHDYEYARVLREILDNGEVRSDRTGVGTRAIFGAQMRFDLKQGFPLLTTKRVYWKGIVEELLWFLRGDTNVRSLQAAGVHIWDEWADENGDLGPVYGAQWRSWHGFRPAYPDNTHIKTGYQTPIDQLENVVTSLIENPDDRGHIVTAWNPGELSQMALRPCHVLFQFDVSADNRLNCQLYQRSADFFLGVPFNIASYALLTTMIAHICGYEPGEFIWTGGNCHVYSNHIEQCERQLQREPFKSPTVRIKPAFYTIDTFSYEDIELVDYACHPAIKAEVAV